jgi:hypothetical protein
LRSRWSPRWSLPVRDLKGDKALIRGVWVDLPERPARLVPADRAVGASRRPDGAEIARLRRVAIVPLVPRLVLRVLTGWYGLRTAPSGHGPTPEQDVGVAQRVVRAVSVGHIPDVTKLEPLDDEGEERDDGSERAAAASAVHHPRALPSTHHDHDQT